MKILGIFLNPEIRTGGHRRYLEFLQALAEKGYQVSLILNSDLRYDLHTIEQIRLPYGYKKKILPYSLNNVLVLKSNLAAIRGQVKSADYIVIFGETHLLAGIYLKKKLNTKLLFALRSNGVVEAQVKRREPGCRGKEKFKLTLSELKYKRYENLIDRYSDLIVFQSAYDRDSFLSRNPQSAKKTTIISGNIGGRWFDPQFRNANRSSELHTVLFLGAVSVRKGIRYLVYAIRKMLSEGYEVQLRIAGEGGLKTELEEYARRQGSSEKIIFLGKIRNTLEEISQADLVVVPSIFDSYPNVILEALHVGTPVIGAASGGIPDMLDAPSLFSPSDQEELFALMIKLYKDRNKYQQLKQAQRELKKTFEFDWAQKFIDVMQQ